MPNRTVPAPATGLPSEQPLSSLIRDPFERTERAQGFAFAIAPAPTPQLNGGAAEEIREVEYV